MDSVTTEHRAEVDDRFDTARITAAVDALAEKHQGREDAFRTAMGLPESAGWQAQAELSRVAKTLSMAIEQAQASADGAAPTADELPALPEASAEAERYATDVMTAFKKG